MTRLKMYLSRLRLRLRAAGVPEEVAAVVLMTAEDHWYRPVETDEEYGYANPPQQSTNMVIATDLAQEWLFGTQHPIRRRRAHQDARKMLAELWRRGYGRNEPILQAKPEVG